MKFGYARNGPCVWGCVCVCDNVWKHSCTICHILCSLKWEIWGTKCAMSFFFFLFFLVKRKIKWKRSSPKWTKSTKRHIATEYNLTVSQFFFLFGWFCSFCICFFSTFQLWTIVGCVMSWNGKSLMSNEMWMCGSYKNTH